MFFNAFIFRVSASDNGQDFVMSYVLIGERKQVSHGLCVGLLSYVGYVLVAAYTHRRPYKAVDAVHSASHMHLCCSPTKGHRPLPVRRILPERHIRFSCTAVVPFPPSPTPLLWAKEPSISFPEIAHTSIISADSRTLQGISKT